MRSLPFVLASTCLVALGFAPPSMAAGYGTLDLTFGSAGTATYDFGTIENGADKAAAVLPRADGSFYVVGTVRDPLYGRSSIAIVRYSRDGTIDASFAPVVAKGHEHDFEVFDAALEADGHIVIGANLFEGIYDGGLAVCRFTPEGARDYEFGWSSEHPCAVAGMSGEALLVHSSGMIVVAGGGPRLVGIRSDGDRENSFGESGYADLGYVPGYDGNGRSFNDVVEDDDGRLVAIATVRLTDTQDTSFAVARFTSDGQLDEDFDGDGIRVESSSLAPHPFDDKDDATAVATLPDKSVVVAGTARYSSDARSRVVAFKLKENGKPDPTFNGGNPFDYEICVSKWHTGCVTQVSDMDVLPSGQIAISGSVAPLFGPPMQRMFALGLTHDGKPDPAFGSGYPNVAVTLIAHGNVDASTQDAAADIALQGERILIGGYATMANDNVDLALARLRGRETAIFASSFEGE